MCSWLPDLGLEGTIPLGGWQLPASLESLGLQGNALSGPLPSNWHLPEGLITLFLSQNALEGPIPDSWDTELPPSLKVLALMDNRLEGGQGVPGRGHAGHCCAQTYCWGRAFQHCSWRDLLEAACHSIAGTKRRNLGPMLAFLAKLPIVPPTERRCLVI